MKSGSNATISFMTFIVFYLLIFNTLFFCLCPPANASSHSSIKLSKKEEEYLKKLGAVKMCVDPDWEPYEKINDKGEYEGIAADLIKIIAEKTGLNIELLPTKNWEESIEASKTGKCQILGFLNQTPERESWLIFSKPYFTDPNVLITRNEHAFISNLHQFTNETIALPQGTSIEERISRDYPVLKIHIVKSENEAIEMVSNKKADMTLRSLTMAAYTIRKKGFFNLKIAGEIADYKNYFRIGISKNDKTLRDIIDKGIDAITPQDTQSVINKYISVETSARIDYPMIVKIVAAFLLILVLGLIWNSQLTRLNRKLAQREKELINLSKILTEDVEARKKSEEQLRLSEEKYRLLFENAVEAIVVIQDGYVKLSNPMSEILTGYSAEEIKSLPFIEFIHPNYKKKLMRNNIRRLNGEPADKIYEFILLKKDGAIRWIEMNSIVISWENSLATLHFLTDITDRKETEDKNYHLMYHDQLTGLYNRFYLNMTMEAINDFKNIGLFMFDIDGLKHVNDTYGHLQGDNLIFESAKIIKRVFGNANIAARIGGDEFVVLVTECTEDMAGDFIRNINEHVRTYNESEAEYFKISISAGYVISEKEDGNFDSLMQKADNLMYANKAERKKNWI